MVEHNGKHPGTVPGRMLRWAEVILDNRVDWRKALGAEIRRGIAAITGLVDYSYQRPSRRAAAVPNVVLPWLVHPIPEVAVVIDTSGSVDIRMLGKALGQVDAILRRLAQRRVRVLACDAVVHDVQTVTSARSIELVGGGGTDLRRGIAAAAALRPRADIVVVLTDGYTPWPEQAPVGLRVVVGLLEGGATTLPTWARVVRIHDTD